MLAQLPLLRRNITLEEALDEDDDILQELTYPDKRLEFYSYLLKHRKSIEDIVCFHLGVHKGACKAAEELREWVHGSFNACIPIYVDESAKFCPRKVFIRFPLPYKVGEAQYPGNAEEKLRSEVATYVWIQDNCPGVPIPCLRGFGFAGGWSFTAPQNVPLFTRIAWSLRRAASWLIGNPIPTRYIGRQSPHNLEAGYLIVDCVEEGKMLSESWASLHHDQDRRANLFAELSRIILYLAQVPFPRIGSLTIDNDGIISLKNRPLTCSIQQLENSGIPTDIPRDLTYSTSDAYLADVLACHDNRMRHMPNSVQSIEDAQNQLSALTMMRALLRHFTSRDLRHGPFVLTLTDLHQSNIFVDGNWHVTAIIDLEWVCTRSVEMLQPPYWLGNCALDELDGENLEKYRQMHAEFMAAFEKEERSLRNDTQYSQIMRRGWEVGKFWFFSALDCPKGLYGVYIFHIQRRFAKYKDSGIEFDRTISAYWSNDVTDFILGKLKDREEYSNQLRKRFAAENGQVA